MPSSPWSTPPAEPTVDRRTDGPGVSHIDPGDPAAPLYDLLARMRTPLALRDTMIHPVRTGYIGQDRALDPATLPPSAADLFPDVEVFDIFVPSDAGPIRCQVYRPPNASARPMLLYMHGGGFTVGQSEDTAYITTRLAAESGVVAVSANYRLAPEWPFPYGLEDCLNVLVWMRAHGADIGGDPERIAVGGDSAGGNFAGALPLMARDTGERAPEAAILLCPVTDFCAEDHASFEEQAPRGIVYDTAFIGFIRGAYAVSRRNWTHPHASPAHGDLAGFPPTLICAGTHDPMIDDNRAFAAKVAAAGGDVELFVREGMPHGWYFFPGLFREGDEAFAAMEAFLRRTLGAGGS